MLSRRTGRLVGVYPDDQGTLGLREGNAGAKQA
jgi:hypothetical protein